MLILELFLRMKIADHFLNERRNNTKGKMNWSH